MRDMKSTELEGVAQAPQLERSAINPSPEKMKIRGFGVNYHALEAGERNWFVIVDFIDRNGEGQSTIAPARLLESRQRFREHFSDLGFDWSAVEDMGNFLSRLQAAGNMERVRLTSVPGWHGKAYCRAQTWVPDNQNEYLFVRNPNVKLAPFIERGSLKQWKKHVAKYARWSTRLRLFLSLPIAALLLEPLHREGFGVDAFGDSSKGKTTLLMGAASVAGHVGVDGITKLDASMTAIQELMIGHRDGFLPLDEVGEIAGDDRKVDEFLKAMSFLSSSARRRERASAYERSIGAIRVDAKVIIGMSSERSLSEIAKAAKRKRLAGETVRLIELPAWSRGDDIFDVPGNEKAIGSELAQRAATVDKLKAACRAYQGVAHVEFLKKFSNDARAVESATAFEKEFISASADLIIEHAEKRTADCVAIAYAAARLGIDYRIFPWKAKQTLAAFQLCLKDILEHRRRSLGSDARDDRTDQEVLREFVDRLRAAKIARVAERKSRDDKLRTKMNAADGILLMADKGARLLIKAERLRAWYPNPKGRGRLIDVLKMKKLLEAGRKASTNTREIQICGLDGGRKPFYAIRPKRGSRFC
jgi:hypothetical protein